ncbi:MAG: TonB-dependent receptor [endosymbiont of Galathealinum brachiosum]|uniref:TonB-dependent receptor n=1 Tax=endosymbiont of Galathealinum brachiosum TaxID=2200906 RepID=A0A370DLA1_9GAMM|nr:MAG: TonB-dependent receptor [endosymbiont of Galathealinum brachiosum]
MDALSLEKLLMKRRLLTASISSLLLTTALSISAQTESEEDDLYLLYGDDEMISIATGFSQPISKAPSTATVITAEDIKAMGALTLEEALESVPGLHYSLSTLTSLGQYNIRGIKTSITPQVLIMMNGYRISSDLLSGVFSESSKINIKNISRIEVIRGPGSAIYGADAFSGVINIVTKNANELNGFNTGVRAGSNDTKNVWAQYGGGFDNGWSLAINVEHAQQGKDDSQFITSDFQSNLDPIPFLATSASLAPGSLDYRYESTTYNIHLDNDNWKIGLDGWVQRDVGQGAGVALALDSNGYGEFDQYLFSVEYNNKDLVEDWEFTSKLSYQSVDTQYNFDIFPSGASLLIGADGNAFSAPNAACPVDPVFGQMCVVQFPDGFLGNPGRKSTIPQLDLIAFYDGLAKHNFRFNVGAKQEELVANESKNFGPGIIDGLTPVIDGTLTDVTGDQSSIYTSDDKRTIKYFSMQDVWSIAADWTFTAGIRYDDYSDFGGTTNPRLALVWNTYDNLTSKLLFGSAFRAPAFSELNNKNNPVAIGNSDLNPETIDTTELAFSYQPLSGLHTNLNIYHFTTKDMISYTGPGNIAENANSLEGKGFELDADWKINKQWRLLGNFAYQSTKDDVTDVQGAFTPQRQLYVDLRWKFLSDWELSSQLNWVGDRERELTDVRESIDDYTLVNLTLRRRNIADNIEAAITINNVFDEDASEPTSENTISDDFPLNEQRIYFELSYHIN